MDDLIPIRKYLDGKGLIGSKNTKQRIQQRAKKFILEKNVLYRLKKEKQLKVLENTSDRLTILKELHDQLGHQGINTTFDVISNQFWWPKMFEDIKQYVEQCDHCRRHAPPKHKEENFLLLTENVFD